MSRRREWILLTLVLLGSAGLRFWRLGQVPPGPSHDEVANWLIAQDILEGNHAIYFTAAYGHEPLYHYVQAATVALFGDHWLGLRWPSVAFGMLGITATYALIRSIFDGRVALLTIGWMSVSFWPLFYARVAYRAILLPLLAALSAYFLFRVVGALVGREVDGPHNRWSDVVLAGGFLGLSVYSYMAARILPVILGGAVVYGRFVRPRVSIPWSRVLLVFLIGALLSSPLVLWLASHPAAERRVAEVRQPLNRLLAGDPSLAWQNLIANVESFFLSGDPWPRYNVPGRPIFAGPTGAVLFVAGLLVALWRWRDPRYGFLLIWLLGSLGPSIVTSEAPSSIRGILGLTVAFVFPSLAIVEVMRWVNDLVSEFRARHSYSLVALPSLLAVLALAPALFLTVRDYFLRWPRNEVVLFDYQADLVAVAEHLEELPPETAVTVAGLSVHTMDLPTLELASQRPVSGVRLCDTRETLVVPSIPLGDARLLVPRVVPFDEDLRNQLMSWGARAAQGGSFTSYRLVGDTESILDLAPLNTRFALPDGRPVQLPASFDGHLALLGYKELDRATPGDPLSLLTYWRVEDPPEDQLRVFLHVVDAAGKLAAQDDGLASPADTWGTGDTVVQKHLLALPTDFVPADLSTVRVGLYEDSTNNRLPVLTADHLELRLKWGGE